jgi:hypothetical protein
MQENSKVVIELYKGYQYGINHQTAVVICITIDGRFRNIFTQVIRQKNVDRDIRNDPNMGPSRKTETGSIVPTLMIGMPQ